MYTGAISLEWSAPVVTGLQKSEKVSFSPSLKKQNRTCFLCFCQRVTTTWPWLSLWRRSLTAQTFPTWSSWWMGSASMFTKLCWKSGTETKLPVESQGKMLNQCFLVIVNKSQCLKMSRIFFQNNTFNHMDFESSYCVSGSELYSPTQKTTQKPLGAHNDPYIAWETVSDVLLLISASLCFPFWSHECIYHFQRLCVVMSDEGALYRAHRAGGGGVQDNGNTFWCWNLSDLLTRETGNQEIPTNNWVKVLLKNFPYIYIHRLSCVAICWTVCPCLSCQCHGEARTDLLFPIFLFITTLGHKVSAFQSLALLHRQ